MRWLLTGSGGMLGTDVAAVLSAHGQQPTRLTRDDLDITDRRACDDAVRGHDVVVNCAAYTAVDAAEQHEPVAVAVNGDGARNLAEAATTHGARMVQISTDYVFGGDSPEPYAEDAPRAPVTAYGRSKLAGELAVQDAADDYLIVRTAWLYGAHGTCFPRTIVDLVAERGQVLVVDDQLGQPTWTLDVAEVLLGLVGSAAPTGIYHATSAGVASWYDFARAVIASAGGEPGQVRPTSSDTFPRPARRPALSALRHDALARAGVDPIGPWQERWEQAAPAVLGKSYSPGTSPNRPSR